DGSPWTTAAVGADPNSSGTDNDGITPTYPADANPVDANGNPLSQAPGKIIKSASVVPFPNPDAAMQRLLAAAQTGGYYFNGTTIVRFKTVTNNGQLVGTLLITNANVNGGIEEERSMPANGLLCVEDGNLKLQAAPVPEESYLKGVLTLCATHGARGIGGSAWIYTNLLYASQLDPATAVPRDGSGRIIGPPPAAATDMLAIIARKEINIQSWTTPNNLEVFGTLMALGDSLRSPVLVTGTQTPSPDKGTFTLVGSLIENRAAPVGIITADGTFGGYRSNFRYDPRVRSIPMPFIPMTGRVEILDTWTIPPETTVAARNWQVQPAPPPLE
ncbi:MAG: hypothetical protein HY597_01330, partial [Candidatus Omnitrophica bacterium]|nr:hypothetical protein [Candidatus Omnitrophota bacterium]